MMGLLFPAALLHAQMPEAPVPTQAMDVVPTAAMTPVPYGKWLLDFKEEARLQGITEATLQSAFANSEAPLDKVVELDRKQPEGVKTLDQYLRGAVNQKRISRAREKAQEYGPLLDEIAEQYGVQKRFIVALWGIETDFGRNTGGFSVIDSLATLAYEGRRADFFRKELLMALQIIQEQHITAEDMTGSWAGAMGQCQFMPRSYLSFAVDHDKDGHKDIWNTEADVFASIANYLKAKGWDDEQTWGREVLAPSTIPGDMIGKEVKKTLKEWNALGVRTLDGKPLPDKDLAASLVFPGKIPTRAFLVYGNYLVLLDWNRSLYFATAVSVLADHLKDL